MWKPSLVLGLVLLCPSGPAHAQVRGGYATEPAVIERLACRVDCVSPRVARVGSVVRVVGSDMQRVRSITFLGGPGDGDDVRVPVLRWARRIADVRVPEGALGGRLRARNGDGAPSAPSVATLRIARRPGADRDTSDRLDGAVERSRVFVAGTRQATLHWSVTGDAPLEAAVELVRLADGASVARWAPGVVAPGVPQRTDWDGTVGGRAVPEGRYEFRLFPVAAAAAAGGGAAPVVADSFRLLDHKFPVRGAVDMDGAQSRFGTGRPGHTHQGHDVMAACGTPLVAARGGVVRWASTQARAGHYLVVDGDGTDLDHVYMHLQRPSLVRRGERVATGQRIGAVGDTGAASGCHLHFETWTAPGWYEGGRPVDPLPLLRAWAAASAPASPRR